MPISTVLLSPNSGKSNEPALKERFKFPTCKNKRIQKMKTKLILRLLFGVWCLVFLPGPVAAQYSITWSTIDGGGGASANGQYSVSGTIGQPDAGPTMSGGNFSVDGGFWSLVSVVQTVGAPTLTLTLTANNTAIVSWPFPSTKFALEENPDLSTANWSNVT